VTAPQDPTLIAVAGRALAAVGIDADECALAEVTEYVEQAPDPAVTAKNLVVMLFSESSQLVSELGAGDAIPVRMQVFDAEGQELSIDDADPPVRTAVRALLAEVHGDSDAARAQVEIALANADVAEMNTVVLQALRWTVRLAGECEQRELPVPDWITQALDN
jgi:hypothetical protein